MFSIAYLKSVRSQIPIRSSLWLQILPNPSQRYDSSSEMLRFVNIVRDKLCETFSIFYHSLHVWYHQIMTNLMIFRLRFLFLEFKNHLATTFVVVLPEQDVRIFFSFLGWRLTLDSITWISFFYSFYWIIWILVVQIWLKKIQWKVIN